MDESEKISPVTVSPVTGFITLKDDRQGLRDGSLTKYEESIEQDNCKKESQSKNIVCLKIKELFMFFPSAYPFLIQMKIYL